MAEPDRRVAPPPLSWAVAAVLLVAGAAAAHWHVERFGPQQAFVEHNQARLAAFAREGAGKLRVLALGTSALRDATAPDPEMARRLAAAVGRPVAVLRIVRPLGRLSQLAPLRAGIAAARPHLVVLHADLLDARPERELVAQHVQRVRRHVRNLALGQGGYRHAVAAEQATPEWGEAARPAQQAALLARYREDPSFQRPPDAEAIAAVRAFARDARVLVLDVPRAAPYEAITGAAKAAWFRQLAAATAGAGVATARFERTFDTYLYADGMHMLPETREMYLGWLLPRLAAPLRGLAP